MEPGSAPLPGAASPSERGRPVALVVDDLQLNRLILTTCLRKLGFDVLAVENGAEGVQTFKRACAGGTLAIVFMDLQMPGGLDGLDVTSLIRAFESESSATHAVPVVLCTAATLDDVLRNAAMLNGCNAAVSKPLCVKAVTSILDNHVPGWQATVAAN